MDGSRFDGMVRSLATAATGRHTRRGVAASVLTGLLAQAGSTDVAAACIRAGQKGCDGPRNRTCCQGATCRGGNRRQTGKCTCTSGLRKCAGTCANTKTDKNHCGGCNKKCLGGSRCRNGVCTSRFGCTAARDRCTVGLDAGRCPGNENCVCLVGTTGAPYCSDATEGACSDCTKDRDCPAGQVCVVANGCGCPDRGIGTGNLCVNPTCLGVR